MQKEMDRIHKKLKMIHNAFEEKRNRNLLQFNLTSSQMDVLLYLSFHEEEVHQREIEKYFGLKNPTVTGILNRLEEKGFIVRRTHPNDRRFRMIELTEKSSNMLTQLCEEVTQMDDRICSCMTDEERAVLGGLLDRILNTLSEM